MPDPTRASVKELVALAGLCEAASGPDRKLDAQIWSLVDRPSLEDYPDRLQDVFDRIVARMLDGGDDDECPRYSSSLDAALTLSDAETDPLDLLEEAIVSARNERDGIYFLPLHICAASLRALAQREREVGGA